MLLSEKALIGKISFALLSLFALLLPLSALAAQISLAAASSFFFFSLTFREGRAALNFTSSPRLRILYIALFFFSLWRIFYTPTQGENVDAFLRTREVWYLLLPALLFFYASSRHRLFILITFFVTGVILALLVGFWQMRTAKIPNPELISAYTRKVFVAITFLFSLALAQARFFSGKYIHASIFLIIAFVAGFALWEAGLIIFWTTTVAIFSAIYLQLFHKAHRWIFWCTILIAILILFFKNAEFASVVQALLYSGVVNTVHKITSANEFTKVYLEYGWVGFFFLCIAYGLILFIYIRERFRLRLGSDRVLASALAVSLPLIWIIGFIEGVGVDPRTQMGIWMQVGLLFALLETDRAGFGTSA
ncbi:MAG: hypothetical protein LDLANPLL_00263 [Turneriella sp.]|nr:hypothetical protein [Turneriella sp.]